MKKFLLLALSPFILLTITCAGNKLPYIADIISDEHNSITSEFTLQIKFYSLDTLTVFDIESQLPENWTTTNTSMFPQTFLPNDSSVFSINIQLPNTSDLPFYPQKFNFYIITDTSQTNVSSTPIEAKIYFTPYNTIEIWNIEDFYDQPREWLNEEDVAPVRSFVAKSAIPVSDIMDLSVYQKDSTNWDDYDFDNFREIDVPGLAYRVLMSPPDSAMLDSLYYDPLPTRRTFTGTVHGRVTATIENDNGISKTIGLSGLRVRLREKDFLGIFESYGETYTDENGNYTISYNKSQSYSEGEYIELFVYVYAETDDTYEISSLIGVKHCKRYHEFGSVPQNGGSRLYDFAFYMNDAEQNCAFRNAHWANKAFKYFANQSVPLGKGLTIKNQDLGSFTNSYLYLGDPVIRIGKESTTAENTLYHEFGHYSMYRLQHNHIKIPYGTNGVADHDWPDENTGLLAWIEGWADAVQMILDAAYWEEDNEYGRDETNDYFEVQRKQGNVNNGFRSEYYIANAIYDLWDGSNKGLPAQIPYQSQYTHGWNDITYYSSTNFNKWKTVDDVELTFAQICTPLQTITAHNELDDLRNIGHYFNILQSQQTNTKAKADIIRCFKENRVLWNINNYNDTIDLGNLTYQMPSQIIDKDERGQLLSWSILYDWVDHYTINPLNSDGLQNLSFVARQSSYALIDDIWLGYSSNSLNYTKNLKLNAPNGSYHIGIIHHPIFYTFEQREILVRNGNLQLGKEDGTYSASLTIKNNSILQIDHNGSLEINNGSSITIEAGGTLYIKSGAHITLNDNATITLNAESYLCIENGAFLHLSSSNSKIYIDAETILGIKPLFGTSVNCGYPCHYPVSGNGEIVCPCDYADVNDLVYSSNKNISNQQIIIGNLLEIRQGSTVTLNNSTLYFHPSAKIIVKPNGKLILNGATLTNTCGEMWQGIELENSESGQVAFLDIDGALIENAICAVKFVSDITKTSSKESTITATNSTFKNNCIDIDIEKKTATYTTVASNFNTCNFIVDANYMGANASTPNDHIHVKLYGTNSKNFRGCNFVGTSAWRGIVAEDAGFTVREKCTNPDEIISSPPCDLCADYTASSFSGFSKAIDVNNAGNQVAFIVKRTDFAANNTYKINVASSNSYKVTYSNFNFPAPTSGGKSIAYYGIYSQNSSGYDISNNSFYQSSSIFAGNNFGIVMRNSGTANNIIILNKFENLNTGLNVMQTNGSTTGTPSGLTFSCNYFVGNKYDISLSQNSTIKSNQGSSTSGANNSFVGTQTSSIYSGGNQLINYYHRNSTPYIPYNPTNAYITPIATTSSPHLLACDYVQCLVAPKNALQQYQDLQNNNQNGSRDSEMTQLSNAAIHALMTDSLPHLDELKQWYSIINTPIAKYSLAETNFELKNYAEAENVLAEIPAMFEFGDKEQIEHNNYLDFHNFKKNLIDSERSYYDLTDAELTNLKQIATTNGRSATMAKGVLCFFYGICLEDEEENSEEAGEIFYAPSQQTSSPEEEIAEENNIVYPNPTDNLIYFDNFAKKSVSLHNSNGILLETTRESFMDLSKYSAGTYFLNINSKMVKVIKK